MDALRRRTVVRESEVFAALFPRGYTPQQQQHHAKGNDALPTLHSAAATKQSDTRASTETTQADGSGHAFRPPKLGMLSPKTPRALMATLPMTANDCTVVWQFLCDWTATQIAMEAPATIPGFGTVTMRMQALKIRVPFFDPDRAFLDKHGLRADNASAATSVALPRTASSSSLPSTRPTDSSSSNSNNGVSAVDVYAFNFLEMAACCGKHVEPARAKEWLETILLKLGEALRQCERVEFSLGVGVVTCTKRVVDCHMLPRHTSAPPKIPCESHTGESAVMKSTVLPASSQTATRRPTYLSGSQFSPAIRLHAAVEKGDNDTPAQFIQLDTLPPSSRRRSQKQPLQGLRGVVSDSPLGVARGASPRTQRLRQKSHSGAAQREDPADEMVAVPGFPALFDPISRTHCVEHDLNLSFLQPSNRIASNFAPIAVGLAMVKHPPRNGASLAFIEEPLPCDPPYPEDHTVHNVMRVSSEDENGSSDGLRQRRAASEERYFAYLANSNRLMDVRWFAPLQQDLVDRIVASAVKYLKAAPSGHMKLVLEAARDEFVNNYHISVKKAILDYMLLRTATRERLSIPFGTPSHTRLPLRWQWGNTEGANGCMGDLKTLAVAGQSRLLQGDHVPLAPPRGTSQKYMDIGLHSKKRRRKRIKFKIVSALMLPDPQVRALHYMWFDVEANLLLVKLPDLQERIEPIDMCAFERTQLAHAAQVRAYVMEHWYDRIKLMFEQSVVRGQSLAGNADVVRKMKHLFSAVAVQMSLQIRSLVMKSIRAYAEFFEWFGQPTRRDEEREASGAGISCTITKFSALLISLSIQDGEIQFEPPLMEISSMLLRVLHNMCELFHNVSRIETQFETSLKPTFSEPSPFLWNVASHEAEIVATTMRIRHIIEQNMVHLRQLHGEYATYGAAYRRTATLPKSEEQDGSIEELFSSTQTEQWRAGLQCIRDVALSLVVTTRSSRYLNLFSVDCRQVNKDLIATFALWMHRQLRVFAEGTASFNAHLRQQYKDVAARLTKRPLDLYELVEAEAFVGVLKTSRLRELQAKVEDVKQRMQLLLFHRESVHIDGPEDDRTEMPVFIVPTELLSSTAKTIRWRTHIERLVQDAETSLVGERARIEAVFLAKRNRFQAETEEFEAEVKSFSKKGDLRHAATYVVQLSKMKEVLVGFKRQMKTIVHEEATLRWKPTDFSKLDDIAEEMEPYEKLWKTAREFRELHSRWLRTNIFELQAVEGLQALQEMTLTISAVSNQLHLNSAAAAITAELIKKQMSDFRENAKIVAAILNPSIQDRHRKELSGLLALTIDPAEPMTFLKLLENRAFDHLHRIVNISETATMEKQIEDALRTIALEWRGVQIHFKTAVKTPTPTGSPGTTTEQVEMQPSARCMPPGLEKSSVSDIQLLVEDHQLRLQAIQCLPHAIPFAQEISRWMLYLHDILLVIDLMVANERLWKRIAPLFSAGIIDDDAVEAALFAQADAIHRSVTSRVERQPLCLDLVYVGSSPSEQQYPLKADVGTTYEDDGAILRRHRVLLSDLQQCRELLEQAGNTVSVGLEARRAQFPRFYFLSDSELIAGLATRPATESDTVASSPQLWRYLQLCFPGIHRVQTSGQREITAFVSAHGEQVPISSVIVTANVPTTVWLLKLESAMATIMQACTRAAVKDFARKDFRKWCLLWPEQVLLTTVQHTWTMQGEIHNAKASSSAAEQAWQTEVETLSAKSDAVARELKAATAPSMRLSLSNVILLLHHLRDVSAQIRTEVSECAHVQSREPEDGNCFCSLNASAMAKTGDNEPFQTMTWLAQPRFYYDTNAALSVKLLSFPGLPYGFEYYGNVSSPVYITPLALRCFHALALNASVLHRGSHVMGPAAAGKKTSTGTFARLNGRLLVHYDGIRVGTPSERFHVLVQFLKGATSCGAWLMMSSLEHLQQPQFVALVGSICSHILDCHATNMTQCSVLGSKMRLKRGVHFVVISSVPMAGTWSPTGADLRPLRSVFRAVEVQTYDLNCIIEFFLLAHKMLHTKSLAKLINGVTQAIANQIELLGISADSASGSVVNIRTLRDIVGQLARLCATERLALCSAHCWPPVVPPTASSISAAPQKPFIQESEMPAELVRDLEKVEINAARAVLRAFASAVLPPQAIESIDFMLRDFATTATRRELRVSESFVPPTPLSETYAGVDSVLPDSSEYNALDIEGAIQRVLRDHVAAEGPDCLSYSDALRERVVHLYHALQSHRAVVIVGDIQSGKTSLWQALARVVNRLWEESNSTSTMSVGTNRSNFKMSSTKNQDISPRRTRTTAVLARAVTLEQFFGSPTSDKLASRDTLLTNLIRDAKTRLDEEDTWLILDGDISDTWADRVLQTTEEFGSRTDFSGLPGLLVPSRGKRMVMPGGMRLLIETNELKHISPAFLAKVSVVRTGQPVGVTETPSRPDWRTLYNTWKQQHKATFAALYDELVGVLDSIVDETMEASLEFVASEFGALLKSVASANLLLQWRVRSLLALLHSFLLLSWAKLSTMVSGKQRKTTIHCYFLQALVWGIGHTSDAAERQKFHAFLREWIINGPRSAESSLKRILVLFFPSGTLVSTVASGLSAAATGTQRRLDLKGGAGGGGSTVTVLNKDTLYSFGFSVELGSKWMRWPELYEMWLADRCQLASGGTPRIEGGSTRRLSVPLSVPIRSSANSPPPTIVNSSLLVRTPGMAAAAFLLYQLMASGFPTLLCGPRDSGKTTCGRGWFDLHAIMVEIRRNNASAGGRLSSSSSTKDDVPVENEHVYSGPSVSAASVLEQLETFVERKRVQQNERTIKNRRESSPETNPSQGVPRSSPVVHVTSATLVFVDDLQCLPADTSSDNAVELLRGILNYDQIVHPMANTVMDCGRRLLTFAALRQDGSRPLHRALHRLVTRLIPVALCPLSDVDLTSICSAYVASRMDAGGVEDINKAERSVLSDAAGPSSTTQHDASQLIANVIKATIRLFRVLCSDQWLSSSNGHRVSSASQASKHYTACTAFQPSKAHYLFHVQDICRVLLHVCGDVKQSVTMVADKSLVAKLWCHEAARVFGDRLSDDPDVSSFYDVLQDTVVSHFNIAPDGLLPSSAQGEAAVSSPKAHAQVAWLRDHLHFTFIGESSGAGMVEGYREVQELQKVELSIERSMMAMYRANMATESLSFVLCTHAIRHVLRLTRVLRPFPKDCDDDQQHLLLIGRRGSKMRTLTRLAAFICRTATTSFFVPRGLSSSSNNSATAWKAALKTALLQCVRQPHDERLVFILQDMWFDNLAIYASLDRLLSGSKLLSGILSYDDFDEAILQKLRDEANRVRHGDTETLSATTATPTSREMPPPLMHSKSSAVDLFFSLVRRKLQFVLIFPLAPDVATDSLASGRLAQLLWQYPYVQKTPAINYFFEWPEESLHVIAQKCFVPAFATERDRLMQLSQVAVQIYQRTRRAWPVWAQGERLEEEDRRRPRTSGEGSVRSGEVTKAAISYADRPCPFLQVEPSMLVEQIALFLAQLLRLQRHTEASKLKYGAGLDFMARTEHLLALEQSQQQLLQPEMAKQTLTTRRMSGTLEKEKLTANKVHHALAMETALVESQRTRLEQVELEYDALIGLPRKIFEDTTEKMRPFAIAIAESIEDSSRFLAGGVAGSSDSIDVTPSQAGEPAESADRINFSDPCWKEAVMNRQRRTMIRSFTAIPHPATSLRQLAECIGLLFEIEPVEAHDELDPDEVFMDYWGSVTTRMQSEAFWQELVAFDVRQRVTESVVARTLLTCTSPDFETALFSPIHELAALLCEWVQACTTFARESLLAAPKYSQLCQERLAYDAAIAQMHARQVEMHTQASTTSTVNAMRHLSEQERTALESKLKENASTLQIATSVWKVLEPCKTPWRVLYEHYTQLSVQAMGDLMLATATMAYAGSTTSLIRKRLRALWSEELDKHFLVHSPADVPRPIHQLFQVDNRTLTKWSMDGLPCQDPGCLESGLVAMQSFLFPVLIDPYRVATAWLKRQLSDLVSNDSTSDENESVVMVSGGRSMDRQVVWQALMQCIKKKKPLLVEDFNETLAVDLQSVLQSKHRARFDVVNQDISTVAHLGPTAGVSVVGLQRRRSSVELGETGEKSSHPSRREREEGGFSGLGGYRGQQCWFEMPVRTNQQNADTLLKTVVEYESDACLVYFAYSEDVAIPKWMAALAPYVSLVRFDFSAAQLRDKCIRTIAEAQGCYADALTEIRALKLDTIAYDEQIETLENELLEYFSLHEPAIVYSDTTEALKVIGNRSALHTLTNSKLESTKKIQLHYVQFMSFGPLAKRTVDVITTWRDLSLLEAMPIAWVWKSLNYAMVTATPSIENQVGMFTTALRQCVNGAFADSHVPMLFDFLLSVRVHERRRLPAASDHASEQLTRLEGLHYEDDDELTEGELVSVLPRLVLLLECQDETHVRTLCAGVSSKLLALRPSDAVPIHKWRALCFLAEQLPSLRELLTVQPGGKDAWKDALALEHLLSERTDEWTPHVEVDALARLCFVAALHKKLFVREVQAIVNRELAWIPSAYASSRSTSHWLQRVRTTDGEATDILESGESREAAAWLGPHTLTDLWTIYSSANVPIVVACTAETDLLKEVADIAVNAKVTVDRSTQEALTAEAFENGLLQSIQKGQWVVLPHFDLRSEWRPIVGHVLTTIEMREVNPDFRLWLSVSDPCHHVNLESADVVMMRLVKANLHSFGDVLHHTVGILHSRFPYMTSHDANAPVGLIVRVSVFHALVSCRDLLVCAPWKMRGFEFHDNSVLSIFQALAATMRNAFPQAGPNLREAIRLITMETYSAGLRSQNERLLLARCGDLVFGTNTTPTMDAASHTMLEVVQVIRIVSELDAPASAIPLNEYLRRIWNVIDLHAGISHDSVVCNRNLKATVSGLRHVLESRGFLMVILPKLLSASAPSTPSRGGARLTAEWSSPATTLRIQTTAVVMEALSRFVIDVEGYDLDENIVAENFPCEYKRPLHGLVKYEVDQLRATQRRLVGDIQYLQQVANASEAPSPMASADFATLICGEIPHSWVGLLLTSGETHRNLTRAVRLEAFQQSILERLRYFQSWLDQGGMPSRIEIDKFQSSIVCIWEVVHQHFLRQLVAHMRHDCTPHCLRVERMIEDKPSMQQLPLRDDVVYVSGWRLFGQLQSEIVSTSHGQAASPSPSASSTAAKAFDPRKTLSPSIPNTTHATMGEIRDDGTPVILEISTACFSTTPVNDTSYDFVCPIHCVRSGDCSITIPTHVPIPQLVFSGSRLCVCSILEASNSMAGGL